MSLARTHHDDIHGPGPNPADDRPAENEGEVEVIAAKFSVYAIDGEVQVRDITPHASPSNRLVFGPDDLDGLIEALIDAQDEMREKGWVK